MRNHLCRTMYSIYVLQPLLPSLMLFLGLIRKFLLCMLYLTSLSNSAKVKFNLFITPSVTPSYTTFPSTLSLIASSATFPVYFATYVLACRLISLKGCDSFGVNKYLKIFGLWCATIALSIPKKSLNTNRQVYLYTHCRVRLEESLGWCSWCNNFFSSCPLFPKISLNLVLLSNSCLILLPNVFYLRHQ